MKHVDSDSAFGTLTGAIFAAGNKMYHAVILGDITFFNVIETIMLSAIGALSGFIITELAKWAKRKITKEKKA